MPRNNFNSIKVQLELSAALEQLNVEPFQFHKGTIRTAAPIVGPAISAVFQFHKGTIRTMGCDNNLDILLFQFHKGTIRTCLLSVILLR